LNDAGSPAAAVVPAGAGVGVVGALAVVVVNAGAGAVGATGVSAEAGAGVVGALEVDGAPAAAALGLETMQTMNPFSSMLYDSAVAAS